MLRVSDGKFNKQTFIRCTQTALQSVNDPIFLTGQTITQANDPSSTTINEATAIVENISRFQIGATLVSEFLLNEESITGTFSVGEVVQGTATDTDDLFIKSTITGIPGTFTIQNDGALFKQNDNVILDGGGGGAICQVSEIGQGPITNFYINAAGTGYQIGDQLTFDNQNTDGAGAIAEVAVVNGAIAGETGSGYDHIVYETATSRNDNNPGDKIVLEECI